MKIENLSFSYGHQKILENLTFELKQKEMLGIVGESGAGKSTLLRLLGGLLPLDKGQIINKKEIGIIFQSFNLFSHLNVIDNLSLALKVNQEVKEEKIEKKAEKLLADFGILDKANAFIDQLSGGEKQRVAIARALMLDPQILLVDEATSNLDPKRRADFMAILKELKENGMSILLVSHDHLTMRKHSDRLIYLEAGKIIRRENLTG
ncbi:MAG: ATP-binding cassette domain-containing protein [Atopostipes sp.]|nr:ATP-binding cassette domain-containing protein [Atopostipes sp.]